MKLDVIHRHDPGGPEADIDCATDGSVLATWQIEGGQLLQTHPELNTGGYTYFTLDSDPIDVIIQAEGGDFSDFSGWDIPEDGVSISLALGRTEPGTVYRAHILLAYEDGPAWHNDTQFNCVTAPQAPLDVLPFTGFDFTGPVILGAFLLAVGIRLLIRRGDE